MFRAASVTATATALAVFAAAALLCPRIAAAQYGGNFTGPRGATAPLQQLEQAGPGSLKRNAKSDEEMVKEAKRKITDADPRVRVQGLEDLRYVLTAEANDLLLRGMNDADVRPRIKAIDVLGARGVNDAVPPMSQSLFLRETPAVEKLHLVAALGRIGDARGSLPVIEYLKETDDTASRGTAVFALGEIGDPMANDILIQTLRNDASPMVRKLSQEALEKIDGELPNVRQAQIAQQRKDELQPTDQKLSKLREMDAEMQRLKY